MKIINTQNEIMVSDLSRPTVPAKSKKLNTDLQLSSIFVDFFFICLNLCLSEIKPRTLILFTSQNQFKV